MKEKEEEQEDSNYSNSSNNHNNHVRLLIRISHHLPQVFCWVGSGCPLAADPLEGGVVEAVVVVVEEEEAVELP